MFYLAAALSAFAAVYCTVAFFANPDLVLPLLVVIWTMLAVAALRAAGVPVRLPRKWRERLDKQARKRFDQRTGRRRRLSER